MTEKQVLEIFKKTNAFLKGHFRLSSGLHSEGYLQCALVLQYPEYAKTLCAELAKKFRDTRPTAVIAPAIGGILVSYEVARALGCRSVFTERENDIMILRRGFSLEKSDRVLVVEDVVTTGGSTKEVIEVVKKNGAEAIGVGAIVDRSGGEINFGLEFNSLIKLKIMAFKPEECPLCKEGIPVVKPGSKRS
jgi:orotate phosphoribosyltransferase